MDQWSIAHLVLSLHFWAICYTCFSCHPAASLSWMWTTLEYLWGNVIWVLWIGDWNIDLERNAFTGAEINPVKLFSPHLVSGKRCDLASSSLEQLNRVPVPYLPWRSLTAKGVLSCLSGGVEEYCGFFLEFMWSKWKFTIQQDSHSSLICHNKQQ